MFSDHFITIIILIIIYFCFSVTPLFFSYHVWISLSATLAAFFFPPYPASFGFILFGLFHLSAFYSAKSCHFPNDTVVYRTGNQ